MIPSKALNDAWRIGALAIWTLLPSAEAAEVIINELMYHPPNDLDQVQYVELHNIGSSTADVSGFRLEDGIVAALPAGTELPAGSYGLVVRNVERFQSTYGTEPTILGIFRGKLSHNGETIRWVTADGRLLEEFQYEDGPPWPRSPDGYSPSLERICPTARADDPSNWAASEMPVHESPSGTPGAANSRYQANRPPTIRLLSKLDPVVSSPRDVTVSVAVTDPDGIGSVILRHWIAAPGGESEPVEQSLLPVETTSDSSGSSTFEGIIPPSDLNRIVRFQVSATDGKGATRILPDPHEPKPALAFAVINVPNPTPIPAAHIVHVTPPESTSQRYRYQVRRNQPPEPSRGHSAVIIAGPHDALPELHDYVRISRRSAGIKVRFGKHQPMDGVRIANIIREYSPRQVIAEHLAYELYRRAGVPTPKSGFIRLWQEGRPEGFQLWVEQPTAGMIEAAGLPDNGNLYKLLWFGRNLVDKHEKKSNRHTGHDDLVDLINALQARDPNAQWDAIQRLIRVDHFASYYAAAMCLSNWDGFFNNSFFYHDLSDDGKWTVIPWDNDKTWGDYDGASRRYDWYTMPLTMGMAGDRVASGSILDRFRGGRGLYGGGPWWRPPGDISGPLLANSQFRKQFLERLKALCLNTFNESTFLPIIDDVESTLAPEVQFYARIHRRDPRRELDEFRDHMDSFRRQLKHRRQFILNELASLGL